MTTIPSVRPRKSLGYRFSLTMKRDWQLWVLLLPCLAFFIEPGQFCVVSRRGSRGILCPASALSGRYDLTGHRVQLTDHAAL